MCDTKFTKGEWVVQFDTMVFSSDGISHYEICDPLSEADAHLIAAAPEMYEEIERDILDLISFIATLKEHSNDWLFYTSKLKNKEQLLAKARGEHV